MNFIYTVYMQSVGGVAKLVHGLVPSLNREITVKSKSGHNINLCHVLLDNGSDNGLLF